MNMNTFLNRYLEYEIAWPGFSNKQMASLALLIIFILFAALEHNQPKYRLALKLQLQSYCTNISLFLFNSTLLSLLSVSGLLMLAERYGEKGLLAQISNPWNQAVLALLILDLTLYFWHRACHRYEWLWRFHSIHHSDPALNTSTAFRVHFVELLANSTIKAAYIFILGIDKTVFLLNETLMTLFVMFHHSNISFPGEHYLKWLFIVPSLHRTHHSKQRHEHDSNYGAVFSLWDQLFATLVLHEPEAIGIKNQPPQHFFDLLKFGFQTSDKSEKAPSFTADLQSMIAEAAYYKAEKRSFLAGDTLQDWVESEKEIYQLLGINQESSHALGKH